MQVLQMLPFVHKAKCELCHASELLMGDACSQGAGAVSQAFLDD